MAITSTEFERLAGLGWRIEQRAVLTNGVWTTGPAGNMSYPADGHDVCAAIEEHSFWFQHRNAVIKQFLRPLRLQALWEIGAGNGFVAQALREEHLEVVAVEPGAAGARRAAQRGVPAICGTLESLRLPDASIPAVGCFDVLEHLAAPDEFLREIARILAPGGRLLVTVPALPGLWSQADDEAGHQRRYTRATLDQALRGAGFRRVRSGYFLFSMVLPLYLLRARPYRRGRRLPPEEFKARLQAELAPRTGVGQRLARALLWGERQFSRVCPLPGGTSLIGIYKRTEGT